MKKNLTNKDILERIVSPNRFLKAIDDFEIDEERALEISVEDKLAKAAQHALEAVDNKYPEANAEMLARGALNVPEFYSDDARFTELAKLVANDPEKINLIGRLLCGELEGDEYYDAIDMVISAEQAANPQLSLLSLYMVSAFSSLFPFISH